MLKSFWMQECKQQTGRTSQIRFSTLRSARSAGAINSKTFANSYATRSKSNVAKQHVSDDGYVLEDHDVITDDGFILTLHRLPRPQSQDAVFFQHGILGAQFFPSWGLVLANSLCKSTKSIWKVFVWLIQG